MSDEPLDDYEFGRALGFDRIGPTVDSVDPQVVEAVGREMRAPMVEMAHAFDDSVKRFRNVMAKSSAELRLLIERLGD